MTEINKRDITRKYLFSFITIAMVFGVEFYLRPKKLGNSYTKSDDLVYDFMRIYKKNRVFLCVFI